MKISYSIGIAAGTVLLLSGIAFAEEDAAPRIQSNDIRAVQVKMQGLRAERADVKAKLKNGRENFLEQKRNAQSTAREQMKVASSSAQRRTILQTAKEKRQDALEERKTTATALKTDLKRSMRERTDIVKTRYLVALRQFDDLTDRIQSRIEKLNALGADTSAVQSALEAAKEAAAAGKADVQALSDIVSQMTDGSDVAAVRAQIEAASKKANASIKAAHAAFETASKQLMELSRALKAQRSETSANTN